MSRTSQPDMIVSMQMMRRDGASIDIIDFDMNDDVDVDCTCRTGPKIDGMWWQACNDCIYLWSRTHYIYGVYTPEAPDSNG